MRNLEGTGAYNEEVLGPQILPNFVGQKEGTGPKMQLTIERGNVMENQRGLKESNERGGTRKVSERGEDQPSQIREGDQLNKPGSDSEETLSTSVSGPWFAPGFEDVEEANSKAIERRD